jgi:hypothetical protein
LNDGDLPYGVANITYMTFAENPREVERNGMNVIDQLDRNLIDISELENANMDMCSLTILFN